MPRNRTSAAEPPARRVAVPLQCPGEGAAQYLAAVWFRSALWQRHQDWDLADFL